MSNLTYPYVTWPGTNGTWYAASLEFPRQIAVGKSNKQAASALRAFFHIAINENTDYTYFADFEDPVAYQFTVPIRPSYRYRNRSHPAAHQVSLRVTCYSGTRYCDNQVTSIPLLGIVFDHYHISELEQLVGQKVREQLQNMSPQQLVGLFDPPEMQLGKFTIRDEEAGLDKVQKERLPNLETVADPLTEKTQRKRFKRDWELEQPIQQLLKRLRDERACLVVIGPPGSGKSTAIARAALAMEKNLRNSGRYNARYPYQVWQTRAGRIIAGMKYLGQWEERCEKLIEELSWFDGILAFDNLLDLIREGGNPDAGLSSFLKPYIVREELCLISEATPEEWDLAQRLAPDFCELFEQLRLPEYSEQQRRSILERACKQDAGYKRMTFEDGLAAAVDSLFRRLMPYHGFPADPTGFCNRCFETAAEQGREHIGLDFVLDQFIEETGLPKFLVDQRIPIKHEDIVDAMRTKIIGQDEACRVIGDLVTVFKTGLNDSERPISVLLFCGPTGVGKTETAKALAGYLFGNGRDAEKRFQRLDMSEYGTLGSASRILYGHDGGPSEFLLSLRRNPFSVVLLDEIEKASADVFDLFLTVLDEGRMRDPMGRTTNFRGTILIMTSNLGSRSGDGIGIKARDGNAGLTAAKKFFRPEFINRIDHMVGFHALDKTSVAEIAVSALRELSTRHGLSRANLNLTWDESLPYYLAEHAYDAHFGARPLHRFIEQQIVTPLAALLVENPGLHKHNLHLTMIDGKLDIAVRFMTNP